MTNSGAIFSSYIDGDVPRDLSSHGDDVLIDAARLDTPISPSTEWLVASPAARALLDLKWFAITICRLAVSYVRSGQPLAIIDFDSASPGPRTRRSWLRGHGCGLISVMTISSPICNDAIQHVLRGLRCKMWICRVVVDLTSASPTDHSLLKGDAL